MEGSITQLGLGNYLINKKDKAKSFFKHNYENYQNYVKDTRRLTFKGSNNFGDTMQMILDKEASYGDLITNMIIEIDLPDVSNLVTTSGKNVGYCNSVGYALIDYVELKINGTVIDRQNREWMDIWSSLSIPSGKQANYKRMIKKFDSNIFITTSFQGGKIYVPLLFWFCQNSHFNNSTFTFPLLALRNNNIELNIKFRNFNDIITSEDNTLPTTSLNLNNVQLLIDYVILEEQERLTYLNSTKQIYLMSQTQYYTHTLLAGTVETNISLRSFKYPVSELFFVFRMNTANNNKQYFNYTNSLGALDGDTPLQSARITFDGSDRIKEMDATYFTQVEPHKVHDNIPDNSQIHCFSFSLQPDIITQPTGVCNFSEIHDPILHLNFKDGLVDSTLFIFALNYNVLQIGEKGTAWLLHALSKSAPTVFPKQDDNSLNC